MNTTTEDRGTTPETTDTEITETPAPHHCPTCGWGSETGGECPRGHGALEALGGAEADTSPAAA